MADVISFAPRRRARPSLSGGPMGQILFFTGIRYERAVEPQPESESAKPARRSRRAGGAVRESKRRRPG